MRGINRSYDSNFAKKYVDNTEQMFYYRNIKMLSENNITVINCQFWKGKMEAYYE